MVIEPNTTNNSDDAILAPEEEGKAEDVLVQQLVTKAVVDIAEILTEEQLGQMLSVDAQLAVDAKLVDAELTVNSASTFEQTHDAALTVAASAEAFVFDEHKPVSVSDSSQIRTELVTDAVEISSGEGVNAQPKDSQGLVPDPVVQEPVLILPLSEMTPQERFRATTRLIFLAPDVPPVQPRQRRNSSNETRSLDDLFDRQHGTASREQQASDRIPVSEEKESSSLRTRSRNRRRQTSEETVEEEPVSRVIKAPITEPQKIRGSTRLEAKKQRRRDGRDTGRRRRSVITESEFLARREAVNREMIVRTTADRVQIGVLEDSVLVEHYVARSSESSIIGNVYLGRVQNVLPSMEAAFVDIGRGRNAVLYSGEVDWSEFEGTGSSRRIENALKPGDSVLVQVTKDPVGHKGARLTSQISLPGRFLVYVPGGAMNGISRKLPDTERARLKKILKEVLPTGAGVIVRTAAEGATEDQLTHDVQRLTRQWDSIQKRVATGGGPVLLHSEPDMLVKIIRDVYNEDFHKLIIAGDETYQVIEQYLSQVAPELLDRVEHYELQRDIFDEYRISEQILKALDRKVWLPSGGSLVIDRTEAMTVVDVNTGKFVGSGGNLEETVTKNNLEAAEEIVRQLRLRDIGGIIVVDFIDMVLESNRDLVLRRLIECLSRDRTKHQVAEVTSLGLVQMTRKKLGLGLLEAFSEPCDSCAGRGVVVHHEPVTRHHRNDHNQSSSSSSRNKRKNQASSVAQQVSSPAQSQPQTHAITDESRTIMAKVAASTIPVAGEQHGIDEAASLELALDLKSEEVSSKKSVSTTQPDSSSTGQHTALPAKKKSRRSNVEKRQQAPNLLDTVLDALPEAPAPGKRKNRRASSVPASSLTADVQDVLSADEAKPSE